MKRNSMSFDWNYARSFLVTAELGSFSAAAKQLGLTQPTLGRQVSALEASLSTVLFERTTRGIELTPSGLKLLDFVRKMDVSANELQLVASGHANSLEGDICITATEMMSAMILPPILEKLRQLHPNIEVELIASNNARDLKKREADIAIRAFRPAQQDLIIRKVVTCHGNIYASSKYIDTLNKPVVAASLESAYFIGFDRTGLLIDALKRYGVYTTHKNFPIIVENHLVHWAMVKQGLGMGFMTDDIANRESDIFRVLPDADPFEVEVWLVAHRELRTNLKVRTVYDLLFSELKQYYSNAGYAC